MFGGNICLWTYLQGFRLFIRQVGVHTRHGIFQSVVVQHECGGEAGQPAQRAQLQRVGARRAVLRAHVLQVALLRTFVQELVDMREHFSVIDIPVYFRLQAMYVH